MLAMCGVLAETTDEQREAFESLFQWKRYPGLRIANWVMPAAHSLSNDLRGNNGRFPSITNLATPLIHSFRAFELPTDDCMFDGEVCFNPRVLEVRPTVSHKEGVVIKSRVDLLQNGNKAGGGIVNFAYTPNCM